MFGYLRRMSAETRTRGISAVEYGLLVAAIAAVVVGVMIGLGGLSYNAFTPAECSGRASADASLPRC